MTNFEKDINSPKQDILKKSKVEQKELSDEKLQNITNNEFLAISPENRLQYITKNHIKSNDLIKDKLRISNLEFSFTFDWKFNRELWIKTTAGQVLPSEVREVESNWIIYKRSWLKWEFFTDSNRRLIINEATKLDNIKIWDISEIKKQDNQKIKEYLEKHPENQSFKDIIEESIKRDIDPDFSILVFWEKLKNLSLLSMDRKVLLEEMFTEFDRLRPGISMWNWKILENWKYPDELVIKLLKEFGWESWRKKAEKYWIKDSEIKRVEKLHSPKYLSLSEKNYILSRVPYDIKSSIESVFPENEVENAILVAYGESWFKINAKRDAYKNPGGWNDLGLFQINDKYHPEIRKYNWRNPEENTKLAYKIFKQAWNSWKPWYAARKIGLA